MLAIVWIAVIVALIVISVLAANEAITKVSIWFIAGAIAALVLSLVEGKFAKKSKYFLIILFL